MARTSNTTRGRFPFVVLGSLILVSVAWAAGPRRDAGKPIVVTDIAGSVDVTVDGASRDMRVDSLLPLPARIVTGSDGIIAIRQVETTVSIAPDSDVEIPGAALDGQLIARMIQHRGNAFYDVETREVGRLHVETPYLVAVVKGTQFNVAVLGSTSTISLFEGRLEIRNPDGGDIVQLEAGEIAIRGAGDAAIRVVRMDEDALPTPGASTAAARPLDAAGGAVAGGVSVPASLASERLDLGARTSVSAGLGGETLSAPALGGDLAALDVNESMALGGAADLGLETGADLRAGSVDLGLDTGLDLGGAGVDLGLDAGVDVAAGSVDLGLDTGVDLGGAGVDLGLDAGVDVAAGSADLGLDTGVDLGGTSANLGLDTGVDVGGGSVDLGLDAGLDVGGTSADLGLDTGVDVGGGSVDVGLDAGLDAIGSGLDAGVDTSVDLGTGGSDPGLDVGLDLGGAGLDVDLGLGGSTPVEIDVTSDDEGSGGSLGGLLNRLL